MAAFCKGGFNSPLQTAANCSICFMKEIIPFKTQFDKFNTSQNCPHLYFVGAN